MDPHAIDGRGRPATSLLYYSAARLSRALNRRASQTAKEHGIQAPQLFVLQVLGEGRPLPNAVVSRRIFVSPQAAHVATQGLIAAGLVALHDDPANARVRLVSLTEAGWQLLDACTREVEAVELRLAQELGDAEDDHSLTDAIHRAAEALKGGYFGDEDLSNHQLG